MAEMPIFSGNIQLNTGIKTSGFCKKGRDIPGG